MNKSKAAENRHDEATVIRNLIIGLLFVIGICLLLASRQIDEHDHHVLKLIVDLLGAFLVIAIPVEVIRERFFEEGSRKQFVADVSEVFDRKVGTLWFQARKFGLEQIEDSLPVETTLFDRLQDGDTLWWLDTFCPGPKRWSRHAENALKRGANLNMLVMDPDSTLCGMRGAELGAGFTGPRFANELQAFIDEFVMLAQAETRGKLELRTYHDLLGVPCYVAERDGQPLYAYSSMYLGKPTGVDFPHFLWGNGPFFLDLYSYVTTKWERATPWNRNERQQRSAAPRA